MQDFRSREFFGNRFLLAAGLLGFWIPLIQAAVRNVPIVSIPETPAEGQDVLLTLEDVTNNFQKIDWYRGRTTDGTSRIFTYFPSYMKEQQRNGAEYTGREMGFPNGSLLITNVQPRDNKQYTVEVVLQFGGALKGTTDLVVAGPGTRKPSTSSNVQTNPTKEAPQVSLMLGWVAAGAVAGVLLAGAIGATLVYRSILHKGKPGTGMAGKLDLREKKQSTPKHDDKESIYEVVRSPVELPMREGKEGSPPFSVPIPVSPGTTPEMESNYMELLCRAGSIYTEIKR